MNPFLLIFAISVALMLVGGAVKMAIIDPLYSFRKWYFKYNFIHGKVLLALTVIAFGSVVIMLIKLFFEWKIL